MSPGKRDLIALILLILCVVIVIADAIQTFALEKRVEQNERDMETLFTVVEGNGTSREVLEAIRNFDRTQGL